MTNKISPRMAKLLQDVKSGQRRICKFGARWDAYCLTRDGQYIDGHSVDATARALIRRGLLAPHTEGDWEWLLPTE